MARFWFWNLLVSVFRTQTDSEDVFVDFLWILYFAYGYFVDINDQKCYLDCKTTELVPVLSRVWRIYSNIRIFLIQIFIRIFVRIEILIRIYSDICSCQNPYECHTLHWTAFAIPHSHHYFKLEILGVTVAACIQAMTSTRYSTCTRDFFDYSYPTRQIYYSTE